jgi:hypothetical protein
MDKRAIFVLFGLLAASTALAQAYRWVDDEGITHYSDRPVPGAVRIILPKSSSSRVRTFQPPAARSQASQSGQADNVQGPFRYESLEVVSPTAEETLWNIEGVLSVSVALNPSLQAGHQVRAYFNGNPQLVSGTSFQIEEVWRGVHNIQVEVINANGKLMIRSQTNRFYVQQNVIRR